MSVCHETWPLRPIQTKLLDVPLHQHIPFPLGQVAARIHDLPRSSRSCQRRGRRGGHRRRRRPDRGPSAGTIVRPPHIVEESRRQHLQPVDISAAVLGEGEGITIGAHRGHRPRKFALHRRGEQPRGRQPQHFHRLAQRLRAHHRIVQQRPGGIDPTEPLAVERGGIQVAERISPRRRGETPMRKETRPVVGREHHPWHTMALPDHRRRHQQPRRRRHRRSK